MSLEKLSCDYKMSGLQHPNFTFYYWAAQMRLVSPLFQRDSASSWTQIKLHDFDKEVKSDFIH